MILISKYIVWKQQKHQNDISIPASTKFLMGKFSRTSNLFPATEGGFVFFVFFFFKIKGIFFSTEFHIFANMKA